MYLSRVEIDIENRRKIKDLTHIGAYHNWVEQAFPQEIKDQERSRKLWRIDKLQGKSYLLIQSSTKPDLEKLESYGLAGSGQVKAYDKFLDKLEEGKTYNFRVVLNPVVSLTNPEGKRGRVVPYLKVEDQMKFFIDRTEKNGFSVDPDQVMIVERSYVNLKKQNKRPVRLIKVAYEGLLTIENLDIFKDLLLKGFGKKKAYGFGLMTLIPVK